VRFEEFSSALDVALKSRGVQEGCPYCHHDDWIVMERGGDFIFNAEQGSSFNLGIPFIILICKNCGNVRLIEPSVLGFDETGKIAIIPHEMG
jgi:hypothetical protein